MDGSLYSRVQKQQPNHSLKSTTGCDGSGTSSTRLPHDHIRIRSVVSEMIDDVGVEEFFRIVGGGVSDATSPRPLDVPTGVHWDPSLGWLNVTPDVVSRWEGLFPRVSIRSELSVANEWLLANPRRRKKNYSRFIESWLRRAAKSKIAFSNGFKEPPKNVGF